MTSKSLGKGANLPVAADSVRAVFGWSGGPGAPRVHVWALLVGPDGRVRADGVVGGPQPQHAAEPVETRPDGPVEVRLAALSPETDRVLLCATAEGGTFGGLGGLELLLTDARDGAPVAEFAIAATTETALVGGELYRRAGQWRFRAVGQGYATGWAGLTADFGAVEPVEAAAPADAAPAPAAPAPAAVVPAPVVPAPVAPAAAEPAEPDWVLPPALPAATEPPPSTVHLRMPPAPAAPPGPAPTTPPGPAAEPSPTPPPPPSTVHLRMPPSGPPGGADAAAPPYVPPVTPPGVPPVGHPGPYQGTPPAGIPVPSLPVDMGKRLSLRKQQVAVSLAKHGAAGVAARVVLVLDASGSMAGLYRKGTVSGVVERMAAVAAQLGEDRPMPAWTFASYPARLPDLVLGGLLEWLQVHVRVGEISLFGRPKKPRKGLLPGQVDMRMVGIQNEEQRVIAEVRAYVRAYPAPVPTLVLFFSDGGVYRNAEIERELREAVEEPVFWQFVGLGQSDYGVLERFDTLPGRRVDNVGFFAVDDIEVLSDPELYDRLLTEFPQWLKAARAAGILH
ncbi:vWA domain-containing protein [Kitasatospora sp. NBC_01539]|uniref:vWA domain-containing protein n=1 Tax=Kitasatospora sp. NBC_01539 TaxID=2903577 RepID=UPI0038600D47